MHKDEDGLCLQGSLMLGEPWKAPDSKELDLAGEAFTPGSREEG